MTAANRHGAGATGGRYIFEPIGRARLANDALIAMSPSGHRHSPLVTCCQLVTALMCYDDAESATD